MALSWWWVGYQPGTANHDIGQAVTASAFLHGKPAGWKAAGGFPTKYAADLWIQQNTHKGIFPGTRPSGGGGGSPGEQWCVYLGRGGEGRYVATCTTAQVNSPNNGIEDGPYPTRADAEKILAQRNSGGGGTGGGGGGPAPPAGGGGPAPGGGSQSGFSGATHGPDVAQWLMTPLCRTVLIPQPGDLAIWGPNEHMGIVINATEMISALDPALGTRVTSIAGAHGGIPVYRRLLATEQAGVSSSGGGTQAQNTARLLLPKYGWGADQFAPLAKLIGGESGWSTTARNPGSGALGIGQALGHGTSATAGTLGNDYGPQYGLSDSQAQAANSGNALQQIRWTLGYIKSRYGTPAAAYAAWRSRTPHWY